MIVLYLQARDAPLIREESLSVEEQSIAMQMKELTGVTDTGIIMSALRLLGAMPPAVVHKLGSLDPDVIRKLVDDRASHHGVDSSRLLGLMIPGDGGGQRGGRTESGQRGRGSQRGWGDGGGWRGRGGRGRGRGRGGAGGWEGNKKRHGDGGDGWEGEAKRRR